MTARALTLEEWVKERLRNCESIAAIKGRADRDGWLNDADYFRAILARLAPERVFRTKDHPEANDRTPVHGEHAWTFTLPLDDGTTLAVKVGRVGRDAIIRMAHEEAVDDALVEAFTRERVIGVWAGFSHVRARELSAWDGCLTCGEQECEGTDDVWP